MPSQNAKEFLGLSHWCDLSEQNASVESERARGSLPPSRLGAAEKSRQENREEGYFEETTKTLGSVEEKIDEALIARCDLDGPASQSSSA